MAHAGSLCSQAAEWQVALLATGENLPAEYSNHVVKSWPEDGVGSACLPRSPMLSKPV